MPDQEQEITEALASLKPEVPAAMDTLLPRVYGELRRIAHRQLGNERPGHTLSTTAVVHEAYLRLADGRDTPWVNRAQFFAVAARTMRRILIDYARRYHAARRGGVHRAAVALDDLERAGAPEIAVAERADWLLALDEALARLALMDERLARVVECRFFAGLTEDETAEALDISPRTVARDWHVARGWLYQELRDDDA
jgi:RNA polymerase sigma factor (TIGR02999 family)